jgi:EmrB/QacA subfamily drug resistance transporter
VPWPVLLRERVRRRARSSDRYRWVVLTVVLAGLLSSNVLFTVFVVALPRVATGLHTSVATTTWVVTAPMLAVAVFVPLAGKLSDRWGHRRLYLIGLVGSVAVAGLSALAPTIGILIAARALGGVAGAGLGASSMALVLALFDKGDRVKAMGWWALVGAGGPVFGVAVGGVLIQSIGWRSLFLLEMVLGSVALLLAVLVLPEHGAGQHRARPGSRLDWPGAALVITAVASLLFGLNRGPLLGWGSDVVLGAFALSATTAAALLVVERRVEDPLVPLHYLARGSFSFPIASQMFSNFAYIGGFFLAPLLLEQVYGRGESAAGLLVIPRPLSFALIAPLAGYVAVRVGERSAAVAGSLAVVTSMAFFAATTQGGGILLVEIGLVLSGVGMGIASPSIAASVANVVDQDALGTASATQQLLVQIATVAGIQVVETVQESAAAHPGTPLLSSFHTAFEVGGAVAVLGVLCALRVRSTVRTPARSGSEVTAIGPAPARPDAVLRERVAG